MTGEDMLVSVAGYIAEDAVDETITIVVGLEGQPLRLEELVTPSRRFRLVFGEEGIGFTEWRGILAAPFAG